MDDINVLPVTPFIPVHKVHRTTILNLFSTSNSPKIAVSEKNMIIYLKRTDLLFPVFHFSASCCWLYAISGISFFRKLLLVYAISGISFFRKLMLVYDISGISFFRKLLLVYDISGISFFRKLLLVYDICGI
jgi:hypothetical protein